MKSNDVPVCSVTANCAQCGFPTTFRAAGLGGDFESFLGLRSGAVYRLDLCKVHHLRLDRSTLLAAGAEREGGVGNLAKVHDEVPCSMCGQPLGKCSMLVDREEIGRVFEL